jgi:hypothetical protein
MVPQKQLGSVSPSVTVTIPELEQSKTTVLNTLASEHSRRSYKYVINKFIAWYCGEPRLTFIAREIEARFSRKWEWRQYAVIDRLPYIYPQWTVFDVCNAPVSSAICRITSRVRIPMVSAIHKRLVRSHAAPDRRPLQPTL